MGVRKFRVGDIVQIPQYEELVERADGKEGNDLRFENEYFVTEMIPVCGRTGRIEDVGTMEGAQNISLVFEGDNSFYPFQFRPKMLDLVKESEEKYQLTVVFDFDGVINSYESGYEGIAEINDPPVEGIKDCIGEMRQKGFKVIIQSSRCRDPIGVDAIRKWLEEWEIEVDEITDGKPAAIAYIDDRAICFDGNAKTLISRVKGFKPWYKKGEKK